jgi:hypothetical protein
MNIKIVVSNGVLGVWAVWRSLSRLSTCPHLCIHDNHVPQVRNGCNSHLTNCMPSMSILHVFWTWTCTLDPRIEHFGTQFFKMKAVA